MIRTSKHIVKFANKNKLNLLDLFLDEYHRVTQIYIDFIWNLEDYVWKYKDKEFIFNIKEKKYDCPPSLMANDIKIETNLSARALKCCSNQAIGIIKAVLEKPRRCEYVLAKLISQGKGTTKIEKTISKFKITKPEVKNIKAELNSICCDFQFTNENNFFEGFIQLKSIGKEFGKIRIPVKFHKQANKWKEQGKIMKSFLISERFVEIRWEIPGVEKVTEGEVLGIDQGIKDIATLSDERTTPKTDCHNHSLESILHKLARKKKGSRAFIKAQEHRKNFINWSINQLDFSNVKQINLEDVVNINYQRRTSRLLSHWTNTEIRDKFIKRCEETGVQIALQSSTYRSQRCFNCGWVQKKNRKSKEFCCKQCGHHSDADLNAAKNHSIELPDVPTSLRKLKLNVKGFYWNPDGFKTLTGEKFAISPSQKIGWC